MYKDYHDRVEYAAVPSREHRPDIPRASAACPLPPALPAPPALAPKRQSDWRACLESLLLLLPRAAFLLLLGNHLHLHLPHHPAVLGDVVEVLPEGLGFLLDILDHGVLL